MPRPGCEHLVCPRCRVPHTWPPSSRCGLAQYQQFRSKLHRIAYAMRAIPRDANLFTELRTDHPSKHLRPYLFK